jgi:hypothetical protein
MDADALYVLMKLFIERIKDLEDQIRELEEKNE